MGKKPATPKVVIKTLGKRTGNVPASVLSKVVREARGKFVVKKGSALTVEDTATGSGHVGFHMSKAKGKSKTVVPKVRTAA